MTEAERSLLIGMAIGDGCITKDKFFKLYHSTKQRDYLEYKKDIVSRILDRKINTCECTHKHYTGNIYFTCGFSIRAAFFRSVYDLIYIEGKKTYSQRLLNVLTPEAIAIWYMDDGSCDIKLNTDGKPTACQTHLALYTTKDQAEIVCNYFKEKYDIIARVRNTGNNKKEEVRYSIFMNTENSKKFVALIKDYIIPSMQYKLRHIKEDAEIVKETGKCSCGRSLYTTRVVNSSVLCKKCRNKIMNDKQALRKSKLNETAILQ